MARRIGRELRSVGGGFRANTGERVGWLVLLALQKDGSDQFRRDVRETSPLGPDCCLCQARRRGGSGREESRIEALARERQGCDGRSAGADQVREPAAERWLHTR